jgi:hypothetical protein
MAGCSGMVSMEELEAQAMITGDWSEVEKRERVLAKRSMRDGPSCPPGTTGYCEAAFGQEECYCVESKVLSAYYSR